MSAFFEHYSKFRKSHRILFFVAVTGWLLYEGYHTTIRTAQENLAAAHMQASSLEQQIIEMQEVNKSMATIQEELRRAEEEMAALRSKLPHEPEIELLLASFSSAAKMSGVRIEVFEPEESASKMIGSGASFAPSSPGKIETDLSGQQNAQVIGSAAANGASQDFTSEAPIAYPTRIKVQISGKFSQIVSFFDRSLTFGRILHLSEIDIVTEEGAALEALGMQRTLKASAVFLAFSQQPIEIKQSKNPYGSDSPSSSSGSTPSANALSEPTEILARRNAHGQKE